MGRHERVQGRGARSTSEQKTENNRTHQTTAHTPNENHPNARTRTLADEMGRDRVLISCCSSPPATKDTDSAHGHTTAGSRTPPRVPCVCDMCAMCAMEPTSLTSCSRPNGKIKAVICLRISYSNFALAMTCSKRSRHAGALALPPPGCCELD